MGQTQDPPTVQLDVSDQIDWLGEKRKQPDYRWYRLGFRLVVARDQCIWCRPAETTKEQRKLGKAPMYYKKNELQVRRRGLHCESQMWRLLFLGLLQLRDISTWAGMERVIKGLMTKDTSGLCAILTCSTHGFTNKTQRQKRGISITCIH